MLTVRTPVMWLLSMMSPSKVARVDHRYDDRTGEQSTAHNDLLHPVTGTRTSRQPPYGSEGLPASPAEMDGDFVAFPLVDGGAYRGRDGQLVCSVSERHERTVEGVSIDGSRHLYQATCAEDRGRVRQLHAYPRVTCSHATESRRERDVERPDDAAHIRRPSRGATSR